MFELTRQLAENTKRTALNLTIVIHERPLKRQRNGLSILFKIATFMYWLIILMNSLSGFDGG